MNFLVFLSNAILPFLVFFIVGMGVLMKQNVYEQFLEGAKDGFQTAISILPTLIGLMVAVGVLRASGLLDAVGNVLSGVMSFFHFPAELVPIALVKMFSSSAATGLLLDLYKEYGTDSRLGLIASIMMSSTETIFYTMSVYFMAAHVKKTRYTLLGSLAATFVGIAASVFFAGFCGV